MKKRNIILLISFLLVFTGCLDFTRYKTGKVLKTGEAKVIAGEFIIGGDDEAMIGFILPKIGGSIGIANGVEISGSVNLISISAEIRKQLIYEEKNGANMSVEAGVNTGAVTSFNGGFTVSKTLKSNKEPYFGMHYNKYRNYYNEPEETEDPYLYENTDYGQLSNLQTTVGIKIPFSNRFSFYPELNIYRYTEEHEEIGNDMLVMFGLGTSFQF